MKTIELSKTGEIYTDTGTQQTYKADSVFQVLSHIVGNDPEYTGTECARWTVKAWKSQIWIVFNPTFGVTSLVGRSSRNYRNLIIIKEV